MTELEEGVEPSPGLERELEEFCRDRLAKYKLSRSIDFMREFPRQPNGKLYKRALRDPYWQGRTQRI